MATKNADALTARIDAIAALTDDKAMADAALRDILYTYRYVTITKHPGTGGLVSVGTVTAQLLYEIRGARYHNPDVTARFDTARISGSVTSGTTGASAKIFSCASP